MSFYNAPYTDISVRTYRGKKENGKLLMNSLNNVWFVPVNTAYRYPQGHIKDNWDEAAFSGCYMQRRSVYYSADFNLKNALEYEVHVGYKVYDSSYNIAQDTLLDQGWSAETPLFSANSAPMYFYWWNIDGASGMLSSTVAAVALLNLF